MTEYTNLTDNELLRVVGMKSTLSALEVELMARLERALDEMDDQVPESAPSQRTLMEMS